jgi:hypothetical protein
MRVAPDVGRPRISTLDAILIGHRSAVTIVDRGVMKTISTAGNTVVPALLALEALGFNVSIDTVDDQELFVATRGDETYSADDPVAVLGLVKLVEMRGWQWRPPDADLERVTRDYRLA